MKVVSQADLIQDHLQRKLILLDLLRRVRPRRRIIPILDLLGRRRPNHIGHRPHMVCLDQPKAGQEL